MNGRRVVRGIMLGLLALAARPLPGRAFTQEVPKSLELVPSAAAYGLQGQILAAQVKCSDALRAFDVASKLEPADPVAIEGRKSCTR